MVSLDSKIHAKFAVLGVDFKGLEQINPFCITYGETVPQFSNVSELKRSSSTDYIRKPNYHCMFQPQGLCTYYSHCNECRAQASTLSRFAALSTSSQNPPDHLCFTLVIDKELVMTLALSGNIAVGSFFTSLS